MRFMVSLLELNSRIDRVALVGKLSEKPGSQLPGPAIGRRPDLLREGEFGKQSGDGPASAGLSPKCVTG
jgi:hypothetical protein